MNRYIDVTPSKCIGCRTCEIACVLAHANDIQGVSAGAPISANEQNEVLAYLGFMPRLSVIKSENVCMPVTCHHCDDAPCAAVCPNGAISHVQNTVQVDHNRCIGCKSCMLACPYGMMEVVTVPMSRPFGGARLATGVKAQAHKCDLCLDRAKGPACVSACPTQALAVFDPKGTRDTMAGRRLQAAQQATAGEARP